MIIHNIEFLSLFQSMSMDFLQINWVGEEVSRGCEDVGNRELHSARDAITITDI